MTALTLTLDADTSLEHPDLQVPFEEYNELLGMSEFDDLEHRHSSP
jgi:hypothetical protein